MSNQYKWTLKEVTSENDLITHAYYHVSATDGENTVETEGNYYFTGKEIIVPYAEVREKTILDWINDETTTNEVSSIKSRLDAQLLELKKDKKVGFPWLANTFKPNI